jgi:hypothetical protein
VLIIIGLVLTGASSIMGNEDSYIRDNAVGITLIILA